MKFLLFFSFSCWITIVWCVHMLVFMLLFLYTDEPLFVCCVMCVCTIFHVLCMLHSKFEQKCNVNTPSKFNHTLDVMSIQSMGALSINK